MERVINVNTNEIITVEELKELHLRECKEFWENNLNAIVEDFKEDGKSFEEYFNYMEENYGDSDYKLLEDSDYIMDKYSSWRKAGHEAEGDVPFTYNCGEASAREDFSEFAGFDFEIDFDQMLQLEINYSL